jgi:hypothetical protein
MKDRLTEVLDAVGVNLGFTIAGFLGSLFQVRGKSPWRAFLVILGGTTSANYLTPLVIGILNVPENGKFACAFLIGTMGLRSADFVLSRLQKRNDAA